MSLSMVDLPLPLGPKSPRMVPSRMVKESSSTARTRPKLLLTRSNTTVAIAFTPLRREHPAVRLPHQLHHLFAPVAQGVHLLHEGDQRPFGHLPPDAVHEACVLGDKRPLAPQGLGDA